MRVEALSNLRLPARVILDAVSPTYSASETRKPHRAPRTRVGEGLLRSERGRGTFVGESLDSAAAAQDRPAAVPGSGGRQDIEGRGEWQVPRRTLLLSGT